MDKREKSRRQWEREILAKQQNITPADFPEGIHHAKVAGLPKITSQARFWIGVILAVVGLSPLHNQGHALFHSAILVALTLVAICAGVYLAVTAIRWKEKA